MSIPTTLDQLRGRYPNNILSIDAGERQGIKAAGQNPALAGLRVDHAAEFTPEASRARASALDWSVAESRPGAVGLEAQARHRTGAMFGTNTRGTEIGSMTGAEAAANPRLSRIGDVFGRNDRMAAMQRNRDFIASGRASMFGPRPATTRGKLAMLQGDLKGQELANQREANRMMAGNDRFKTSALRQLKGQELANQQQSNLLKYNADMAETAATKQLGMGRLEQEKQNSQLQFQADKLKVRADILGKAMELQQAMSTEQTRGIADSLINDEGFITYMKGNLAVKSGWDPKLSDEQNVMRVFKNNPIAYGLAYLNDVKKMNVAGIGADNTGRYDFDAIFQNLEGGFGGAAG